MKMLETRLHRIKDLGKEPLRQQVACLPLLLFFLLSFLMAGAQPKIWTLKACISLAMEKNIALNQSALSNEATRITWQQSRYMIYPNLNLSDAQNFSYGRSMDPVSYEYTNQNVSSNIPALSSSVTLFGGLHNLNTIRENKLNYDAGSLDLEKQKNDLALSVLGAYMQVLLDEEAVNIANEQMALTAVQVDRTEKYVTAGKYPELNLLQIKSQLASDKSAEVDAENTLQIARVTLMQLLELPVSPDFEIEKPSIQNILSEAAASAAEDVYKTALALQPQIKSAELRTQAAMWDLKIAEGALLPTLSLTGTLRSNYSSLRSQISSQVVYQQENIGYLQSNPAQQVIGPVPVDRINTTAYPVGNQFSDNFGQLLSFTLTVPLFNNFQVKSAISKSKISVQNAKLNEESVKIQLRKLIEQAYTDQTGAAKKLVAVDEQERSEERTYGDMEKKFNAGMASTTDYLIEKNNYNKAMLSLISAKYDYVYKSKVMDFYLGKPVTF
jgi:outer membrane protein